MKKAILIPGTFYSMLPVKPGMKAVSDDIVELTHLDTLLNDGWAIASITANPTEGGSYLIILQKD